MDGGAHGIERAARADVWAEAVVGVVASSCDIPIRFFIDLQIEGCPGSRLSAVDIVEAVGANTVGLGVVETSGIVMTADIHDIDSQTQLLFFRHSPPAL